MENENIKKNALRRFTDKLFGGLNMSWLAVILFAVGSAVVTSVFLIVPFFIGTSFELMGVQFEAWIFFAVIIMSNCKKPLESAVKTFVFFLISQPLIYLFQVPFSWMGWSLFGYYGYWFILTLLTFPVAFVGWFITKRNWISVLIFAPILAYLGMVMYNCANGFISRFPHLLVAFLFCLAQVLLYVYAFFPKLPQRLVGLAIPVIVIIVMIFAAPKASVSVSDTLPNEPSYSSSASITVGDDSVADVTFLNADSGRVQIELYKQGTTEITVKDADKEVRYTLEIYDDNGVLRERMTAE